MVSRIVNGRLARLEGSLNCLIHSQLGAAQLLAHQLKSTGTIGATQPLPLAGWPTVPMSSLQVSLLLRLYHMLTSVPIYSLKRSQPPLSCLLCSPQLQSQSLLAPQLTPSSKRRRSQTSGANIRRALLEELERLWQARWRPSPAQRITWCRRKVILDEIGRLIQAGSTPADAVAQLEAQRGSSSLRNLQALIKSQKAVQHA
jgi:hypothetical protein